MSFEITVMVLVVTNEGHRIIKKIYRFVLNVLQWRRPVATNNSLVQVKQTLRNSHPQGNLYLYYHLS